MRRLNHIQLDADELQLIISRIKNKRPCKLLVFGLGNDSLLWNELNRGGKTLFVEDNLEWLNLVKKMYGIDNAVLVDYGTKLDQWQSLLDQPEVLGETLHQQISAHDWDFVLVDAPAGWHHDAPGRMKSIFTAAAFLEQGAEVFVHDCNREVENHYCNVYLKQNNFRQQVGKLRHYQQTGQAT